MYFLHFHSFFDFLVNFDGYIITFFGFSDRKKMRDFTNLCHFYHLLS